MDATDHDDPDAPTASNVSRWLTGQFDRLLPCGWFVAEQDGLDVSICEHWADGGIANHWTLTVQQASVLLARLGTWQVASALDVEYAIGDALNVGVKRAA